MELFLLLWFAVICEAGIRFLSGTRPQQIVARVRRVHRAPLGAVASQHRTARLAPITAAMPGAEARRAPAPLTPGGARTRATAVAASTVLIAEHSTRSGRQRYPVSVYLLV
ncbi:hypothetical protein GWI33_021586 [Rhynchophorus ferrugineus]|uniref:Secreted protein n=1 Tax=Rhynchophorus ferrugineus TaxID=354439 RepID=A0A834IP88_RHYFE|nr:hypothetical protein GWI33_021586 [Rhynchophorus ferrugineus]